MKPQTYFVVGAVFLQHFFLSIADSKTPEFDKRDINDCVAHDLEEISNPLLFPIGNASRSLIIEVRSLLRVELTVTSSKGSDEVVLQRCSQDSFCANCHGHPPIILPLEKVFRLSFFKHTLTFLSGQNRTEICSNFSTEFQDELNLDFRLVNPLGYSFKGVFSFNCEDEPCWKFHDVTIHLSPKIIQKQTFYFKTNEENETATLHGLGQRVSLLPSRWWKKMTLEIEKEKIADGKKILSLRDESHLVFFRHLEPLAQTLKLWTNSSNGVFWTLGCLPNRGFQQMDQINQTVQDENQDLFLESGLTKANFLQIILFAAGILTTGIVAILFTFCAIKCFRKKPDNLSHLEGKLSDTKSKSKSPSLDSMGLDSRTEEYEQPLEIRYTPLVSQRSSQKPEKVTSHSSVPLISSDSDTSINCSEEELYMDMKPFTHLLQKNEDTQRKEPMSTIYESLGSLIDDGNTHIYDTLKEINEKEVSTNKDLYVNVHRVDMNSGH